MGLQDISLKWKLLIPFLLLSFAGTTTLVLIAFHSQHALIHLSERRVLEALYQHFLQSIQDERDQALSLATSIALDPEVQKAFVRQDRKALLDHLSAMYQRLQDDFGTEQIHFHTPPATSFLRVHRPEQFGEDMSSYRSTILRALETGQGVGGLELGDTGYGIRGVVPIKVHGEPMGTVEVGFSFGAPFIREFKARYNCDLTLYVPDPKARRSLIILASTMKAPRSLGTVTFKEFEGRTTPMLWMPFPEKEDVSGLLGPVRDFSDRVTGLVEIQIDRAPTSSLLQSSRTAMTIVEIIGLLAATLVVWAVVQRFLQPIKEMVRGAAEIVAGDRLYMPIRGRDEMGQLSRALNNMVGYLEASRQRMKDYAQNLEQEVQARTLELRQSEEKYRSLVERVPLVVYQMSSERQMTFVNQFAGELLGVDSSDLLAKPGALDRLIHREDRRRVQKGFKEAMERGREWVAAYRMELPQGRTIHVQEHAVPLLNDQGEVTQVDGILVDATDQKKLQEKTIQAEELRTLGEVSARLAHEIRNPLTSIGGLSRRLLKELPEDHSARRWVHVVVKQVERLEGILRMILSYIQPITVQLTPSDLGGMMEALFKDLAPEFKQKSRDLSWDISAGLPQVSMDPRLLRKAMENLYRHTLFLMDEGESLRVRIEAEDELLRISWRYHCSALSSDDLEHYFYPFLSQGPPDSPLLDLPVAKIILHKHGGLVSVSRGEGDEIIVDITLPASKEEGPLRPPEMR